MSHWFHRNPLKATGPQNFEIKMFAHDSDALKVSARALLARLTLALRSCPT